MHVQKLLIPCAGTSAVARSRPVAGYNQTVIICRKKTGPHDRELRSLLHPGVAHLCHAAFINVGLCCIVGEETADAEGKVTFLITIPPDFPPGDHTLILVGQNPGGSERRLTEPLVIEFSSEIFKDGFE